MEENGDNFRVTVTTGSHVIINSFTIGQETEMLSVTGEKIKVSKNVLLIKHGNAL